MAYENPNWMQVPTYSARLDRALIKALFTEGVLDGLSVTQRGAGANMSVDVSIGACIIYGDDQANQGAYQCSHTAVVNVVISAAPGTARIDLVYARVNDPNATGPAGSNWVITVLDGTPGASPSAPALPTSAIPLAYVRTDSGDASVVDAKITDARIASRIVGSPEFGTLEFFPGDSSLIPADRLLAYGQAVNRRTYFGAFRILGVTHGAGDGSTTFNLPDMRGRGPMGLDNMGGVDAGRLSLANTLGLGAGSQTATLTTTELPAHTHTTPAHYHSIGHDHAVTATGAEAAHTHSIYHNHGAFNSGPGSPHTHDDDAHNHTWIAHYHAEASPHSHSITQTYISTPRGGSTGVNTITAGGDTPFTVSGHGVTVGSEIGGGNNPTTINIINESAHYHSIDVPELSGNSGAGSSHTHSIALGAYVGNSDTSGSGTSGSAGTGSAFSVLDPCLLGNWVVRVA